MEHNEILQEDLEKAIKQEEKTIAGFFVRNFRITYLLLALITLFGFYAIFSLPKEAEPEVKVPYAMVTVAYPGGNPADIEDLILEPLEEKIKNVDNIKQFGGSAGVGYANISVQFEAEAEMDTCLQDLKDAVDEAKGSLPDDATEPSVKELNFNDTPIVTYSFSGEYNDVQLKQFADRMQSELESIKDVSKVPILGGVEREFHIKVDQEKLSHFQVSLSQIVQSLQLSNFNLPSGDIEVGNFNYGVRVRGKFESIDDVKNVIVAYTDEAPIYLQDIAIIDDGFKERTSISKVGIGNNPSQNTVSLQVYKRTGGNILNIVKNSDTAIEKLQKSGELPADLKVIQTNDNSEYIRKDIMNLGSNGLQTMALIVLFLFAVLGLRGSIITGLSVPIAFLIAFIAIMFQGMTINSMVLFALVLSLGLMVDNAIVVMEGINEYMQVHGKTPYEAALLSIWNYRWPIISGTMTTVAAFFPMLLVSGIIGEYMSVLPKTLNATLLASLFTSIIIIPTLAVRFYKPEKKVKTENKYIVRMKKWVEDFKVSYVAFLRGILLSKKKQNTIIWSSIGLLVFTVMLPIVGVMKVELFPSVDVDYFVVNVESPIGSNLETTNTLLDKVENVIREIPELDNYVVTAGEKYSTYGNSGNGSAEHYGSIIVNLLDEKERERTSYEVASSIRDEIESIEGGKVKIEEITAGPPTGAPLEAKIYGTDFDTLYDYAQKIKKIAENTNGFINVTDSVDESNGEFVFTVDRERAKYYGLDVTTIASTLRQALYGVEATTITVDGDDISVIVKYNQGELQNSDDLGNILLLSPRGESVMLRQVAKLDMEPAITNIQHLDGEKVISITAQLESGGNLREALASFESQVESEIDFQNGYKIELGGETEDIEKSFTELFLSMFVAIFLIMFILVLQFNSFKKPFIIICSLPLAIVGAFFGLTLLGLGFSLPAFIGFVSLAGIVVNDAIVLMDRIEKNLERNMDFMEGILEAGVARMQPIFLTSATTIAGIFPLAISDEMWAGLGFSIIFGLLFSTVLTLVYVPILFLKMCKKDYEGNTQK